MIISSHTIKALLAEHNNFHDGLVREVHYVYSDAGYFLALNIYVYSRTAGKKSNLILRCDSPIEFRFVENNTCSTIISDGMQIRDFGGVYYVAISPYCDDMDSVDDYRLSDFYFASRNIVVTQEAG